MTYGRISGIIIAAREMLLGQRPATPQEEHDLWWARWHLDSALMHLRRLHHGLRWWRKN